MIQIKETELQRLQALNMIAARQREHAQSIFRAVATAALFTTAMLLSGCESTGAIATPDEVPGDTNISFGRVEVLSPKTPTNWIDDCGFAKYMICPDAFRLIVLPAAGGGPITHRLEGDGTFYWSLPPGEYSIAEWEWEVWGKNRGVKSGIVGGQFVVPASAGAAYLGTLTIALSGPRYAMMVKDDYEAAAGKFQAKMGSRSAAIRSLITLGETPDGQRGPTICSADWGLECSKHYRGVTPTSPVSVTATFPKANSLTPELRWVGSTDPEVTYDLVLYEALAYSKAGSSRFIHGPRIAYAQGLREPKYTVEWPLKPGSKYFWTVRLRKGDQVSDWSSSQDRSFFFIGFAYGWSASAGVPFNFETP